MKKLMIVPTVLSLFLVVTACSHKKDHKDDTANSSVTFATPMSEDGLESKTADWPGSSKSAISTLKAKYGEPETITEEMVVWNATAPFKRSVVFREEIAHNFPMEHMDVLMQTVDYRVPADKVSALSKFDGSLIVDRTRGELSTRNDKEEMNILSLNLADKIIRGQLSVEAARREFTEQARAFASGTTGNMITTLTFKTVGNTADKDAMMQAQEDGQSTFRKTRETKKVRRAIED